MKTKKKKPNPRNAIIAEMGRLGGSAGTGAAKRRDIDYAELAKKSHLARAAKTQPAKKPKKNSP